MKNSAERINKNVPNDGGDNERNQTPRSFWKNDKVVRDSHRGREDEVP